MIAAAHIHDAEVRERITTSGLDETLFVEAGAGTGKTTQLVGRVVNLVLSGRVRLREVAAITFTEAAAAELRDRIRVALERQLASSDDPVRIERCRHALADADQAAFTTLHGFALRILSEHPMAAGLPPRVQIADEIASTLAFEERWVHFVDRLYNDARLERLLVRAAAIDVALEPRYPRQATLKDVAATLNQSWDRLESLAGQVELARVPLPPLDVSPIRRAVEALAAAARTCSDPRDLLARRLDEYLPVMRALLAIDDPDEQLGALRHCQPFTVGSGGKAPAWSTDVKAVKQLIRDVNEAKDATVRGAVHHVLERFKLLVAAEVWSAADERRQQGALEFHDLLVLARQALRHSAATRASLSQRYRCLLLDEFQDTDPLQIEIATLIAGAVADQPAHWREASIDAGRLFFVGDPKQSIYRFRRADIGLFLEARDAFGTGDALVRLSTNFRTVEPIIDWVNELFTMLMPEEQPGQQPRYEPLRAVRHPLGGDHRVMLLGGPTPGLAGEVRQAEAAHLSAVVDDIRRRPEAWPVQVDGEWRPAELSDVTILVPTRMSLPYLRAALDRAGLPYRLDTGTLVFDTQEIRDVLAAVRAIDDPSDEASLVAALRSPLYGCSDVDLFTWHQAGGRWTVTRPAPDHLAAHPVSAAVGHLRSLWRERWWLSPGDVVERLVRERQALLAAFGDDRPSEVHRRLRFLIDQARAFDAAHGGGLRAFTEWAALQVSSSSRVHEPLAADTDHRGVRIMTIHGAKGLEFPITILSGMSTQPAGQRHGAAVLWDDEGLHVRVGSKQATEHFDPRAEVEDEMSVSEWLRLLYVAATRAADHLVVSCYHGLRNARSYGRVVHELTADRRDLHRPAPLPVDDPPAAISEPTADLGDDGDLGERAAWIARRAAGLAEAGRPRFTSATAVATAAAAPGAPLENARADPDGRGDDVVAAHDSDDLATADEAAIPWRRGRAGTAIGRAVHATLQSLDLHIDPADPLVEALAQREAELESLGDGAPTVAAMVRSALRSEALELARRHPYHKEIYVAAPVGERIIEGYIDLLVDTPEGLVVVDYKTDTVRSEADVDAKLVRYELQGAAYVVALEHTTGVRVATCRFVFCRPAGAIERSVADLDGARRRVRSALGQAP